MARGKPVQERGRVELPAGVTWVIGRHDAGGHPRQGGSPKGSLPLPHPHHAEGGMVFRPSYHGNQTAGRARSDPFWPRFRSADHVRARVPPPFFTTRPDLGCVQGKL